MSSRSSRAAKRPVRTGFFVWRHSVCASSHEPESTAHTKTSEPRSLCVAYRDRYAFAYPGMRLSIKGATVSPYVCSSFSRRCSIVLASRFHFCSAIGLSLSPTSAPREPGPRE